MFKTTGKKLRQVTGWDEIDFVADGEEVRVHEVTWPYAAWLDAQGVVQPLGGLTAEQVAQLKALT
jgi:hypothetical protein